MSPGWASPADLVGWLERNKAEAAEGVGVDQPVVEVAEPATDVPTAPDAAEPAGAPVDEPAAAQPAVADADEPALASDVDVPALTSDIDEPPTDPDADETADDPDGEQPETDQPQTDQPETDQPETDQPETDQPETDQPEPDEPEPDEPATPTQTEVAPSEPETESAVDTAPLVIAPGTPAVDVSDDEESAASEPESSEPEASEPEASEPEASEPEAPERVVAEPEAAEPVAPQPVPAAPAGPTAPVPAPRQRTAVRRRLLVGALGLAGVTALGVGGAAAFAADLTPRGTSIGGVDVGGLRRADAVRTLTATATTASTPVTVSVAGAQASIDPQAAGLRVDAAASVDAVLGGRLDLTRMWRQVVGGEAVASLPDADRAALRAALAEVDRQTRRQPVDGAVTFGPDGPRATAAVTGVALDLDAAVDTAATLWLARSGSLALPVDETQPAIDQVEVDRALTGDARTASSGSLAIDLGAEPGKRVITVTQAALLPVLSMRPDGDDPETLALAVDGAALRAAVLAADPTLERGPKDAQIVLRDGRPQVVPSVDGVGLDPAKLAAAAEAALLTPERTARVEGLVTKPKLTTEQATALGVTEQVSTFSTNLTSNVPRTNNLRIAARTVNGTLVMPGETFSLNKVLGQRTPAKGYAQAPVIYNGRLELDYGGGVSQMATTVFNNAFFAGMEIVEHLPHSFYISRYPEGREATVSWPSVDLKWRNDSPYAVLVQASVGSKVTVSFWSTEQYDDVTSERSARRNVREPTTIYDTTEGCVEQTPSPGFDVTVRRKVVKDGKVVKDQAWTTKYIPEDEVICGPEPVQVPTVRGTAFLFPPNGSRG